MVWLLHTNVSLSGRGLTGILGRHANLWVVKTKITTESLGTDSLTCPDLSSELELSELRPPGEETITRGNCEILRQESFQKILSLTPSSHLIFTQTHLSCFSHPHFSCPFLVLWSFFMPRLKTHNFFSVDGLFVSAINPVKPDIWNNNPKNSTSLYGTAVNL